MHIRTFLKPLSFIPAIILMYMIFSFSAQTGDISSSVSYKASCVIVKTADNVFDMGMDDYQISYYATKINGVTRKLAHMTEYFLLAIAVSFPLYVYGVHGILLMILAGGICIAFACGDEYHQSFVAGRLPSAKDVGIDSVGVFIGIIIVRIIGWTGRMTIFRPIRKKTDSQKLSMKQQKAMEQMQQNTYNQGYTPYQDSCSQAPDGSYACPNQNYPGQGFPNPSGYPYPKDQYSNQPYSQGGYASGYPGQSAPYPSRIPLTNRLPILLPPARLTRIQTILLREMVLIPDRIILVCLILIRITRNRAMIRTPPPLIRITLMAAIIREMNIPAIINSRRLPSIWDAKMNFPMNFLRICHYRTC